MAILGNIIKGVIEVKDALTTASDPIEEQRDVLKHLLTTARDTVFGRHYNFEALLQAENTEKAFSEAIPFYDYNEMYERWWQRQLDGEADITWPGSSSYFAMSSGTTGKTSKRIPVTDAMIESIRQAGIKQVFSLSNFEFPADFFEKEILMLGSSTDLEENDGRLEGEISGISASNIPFWFRKYYKPGEEIASIDDWDRRVAQIAEKAPEWDIGALSGIPSCIELMLEKVIEKHGLDHIHQIWPNLQVYTSGGVAFGPYEKSFRALMGKPVTVIDTYLASEGFIAFQSRPETHAMKLITDNGIYFEFVPFEPDYILQDGSITQDAPCLNLSEVEEGKDYVLVISTVSGAWRYLIGDTISFTNMERAEIIITGRTKFFLNTVGSQLSVNKLDDAVKQLEDELELKIPEYTLCAKRYEDGFYHTWYLGTKTKMENTRIAAVLDEYLKEANKNYRVARSKALEGVKVHCIAPSVFYEWNGRNKKKGGQVKMERVMGEDKFREWEEFVAGETNS
ncbi:GH3 auxin-responsive promoter family protein [Zeaxanthinibacter sp. PT1]|uniref:GH3 family domain-containing protein n=1 Tax=Zeaxanthinibacter TaxID=561554 RepID=UPI00234B6E4D|nr:GH3 auxin-responsive promoter family protein [Zeaxanthinibacter sp. PT1]MDC6351500.1 GH3 auxin-responsive promoter family protein [Zeaxanthinibacter sp. PT1]